MATIIGRRERMLRVSKRCFVGKRETAKESAHPEKLGPEKLGRV